MWEDEDEIEEEDDYEETPEEMAIRELECLKYGSDFIRFTSYNKIHEPAHRDR